MVNLFFSFSSSHVRFSLLTKKKIMVDTCKERMSVNQEKKIIPTYT